MGLNTPQFNPQQTQSEAHLSYSDGKGGSLAVGKAAGVRS